MELKVRPPVITLPSYSLTGDLLGFLRCGLQYRYTRIGRLPTTRPLQLWFGQYIHGVLEEGYRQYADARSRDEGDVPPWPDQRLAEIGDVIKRRLAAQGLFPWEPRLEALGDLRAKAAINDLGPELFPLIHRAEVRLTGARLLPRDRIPAEYRIRAGERYEIAGVIDVITHVELHDPGLQNNELVRLILEALPREPAGPFEVILDYKGMRRPSTQGGSEQPDPWSIYGWQVMTYAHLRSAHQDSLPIEAGVVLYLNELHPIGSDIEQLKREIRAGQTDVVPPPGTDAEQMIQAWRPGQPVPDLPFEFRLRRAVRVVPVDSEKISEALERFDDVVVQVETCRGRELVGGHVIDSWEKNPSDQSTCAVCDYRTYCPSYHQTWVPKGANATPILPSVPSRP